MLDAAQTPGTAFQGDQSTHCSVVHVTTVNCGATDEVIDYTKEDFTKTGQTYDLIFDVVAKSSFSRCKSSLKKNGVYLSTFPALPTLLQMLWTSKIGSKKAMFSATGLRPVSERISFLKELIELFEAGKIKTIIDRRYSLEQIAEAHRYVEKGGKKAMSS